MSDVLPTTTKRYRLVCVAGVRPGWSFDDPDEAIINCDAHSDVLDTQTGEYLTPTCQEEVDEARARWEAQRAS